MPYRRGMFCSPAVVGRVARYTKSFFAWLESENRQNNGTMEGRNFWILMSQVGVVAKTKFHYAFAARACRL
jgi:hypothetical protein